MTKKKTKKKPKRSTLKKILDKVFSQYIRRKDADKRGYATCVTCGSKAHWKQMQAGHFVPRNITSTRWDETNVHVQCAGCNVFNKGRMDAYALYIVRTYGEEGLESLLEKKSLTKQIKAFEIEEMIEFYQDALTGLDITAERDE